MNKYIKLLCFVMAACISLTLVSCSNNKQGNNDINSVGVTTVSKEILTTSNLTENNINQGESNTKQIIKNEYTYKDILDLKVKLPKYEKVETIKSKKYTTDLYCIEPNEVIAGISLYFSKDLYPNNDASSDYQEITSMVSVNKYTVTDSIRTLKNIKDKYDFCVREFLYTENKDVKTKHNVYKVTGYIYTDLFADGTANKDNTEEENLVYYYSNIIKVGDKAVVLWVMDLTQDHIYQQECAKILNDIMMEKI